MQTIIIVLIIFFILLFLNVPIGTSMGVASIIGFILIDFNLATVGSIVFTAVSSVSLMCIPGYILAGSMMSQGGIADALVKCMSAWIGHLPGGLSIVTVVACAFFAAITGSSAATLAAVGGLMIPAMLNADYDKKLALGVVAGAAADMALRTAQGRRTAAGKAMQAVTDAVDSAAASVKHTMGR